MAAKDRSESAFDAKGVDGEVGVLDDVSALTTGWDCPRAEVLVSFQGRDSYTEIAQLIGRLVRTPLATRVEGGDDRLNEVVAYLPRFKVEHVSRVVKALTEDETVQVEVMISPEICGRSSEVPGEVLRAAGHAAVVHAAQDDVLHPHRATRETRRGPQRARPGHERVEEGTRVDREPDPCR
ncbi:MAG: hypothetical protein WKF73_20365 [Nocardioidaceae bacterium]